MNRADRITAAYEAAAEAMTNLSHACGENEDTFWTLFKTMQVRVAVERAEYLNDWKEDRCGFGMFSTAGDAAVQRALDATVGMVGSEEDRLNEVCARVYLQGYAEVYDTAVREAIYARLL